MERTGVQHIKRLWQMCEAILECSHLGNPAGGETTTGKALDHVFAIGKRLTVPNEG
jgi:hypothetical protein